MIQQQFKKCGTLAESACMLKFLDLLRSVYRFDRERFRCEIGVRSFLLSPWGLSHIITSGFFH